MKKVLLSFLTLMILNVTYGQTNFGFKAGVNLANVKDKGPTGNKPRIGLHAGGLLQVGLSEKFMLQPELLYSIKGYRFPATQFSGKGALSLNYINIPVLVGYRATENLSILVGPEIGFLTSAKSAFDENTVDVTKNFNDFDLGIDFGVSYNVNEKIGIDLRYNYGFKGLMDVVYTDQNGSRTGNGKAGANRVLQVGIFYAIAK